jgi:hypothetical protein
MGSKKQPGIRRAVTTLCWALFFGGLMVQAFAPRLKIENNKFVLPEMRGDGQEIRPHEIVSKERRMQLISALLTTAGAVALGIRYRRAFRRPAGEQVIDGHPKPRNDLKPVRSLPNTD